MEQPIEAPVPTVEDTEKETSAPKQTLEEVVQRLKEINEKNDLTNKQEIDSLKQTFYKLQKAKSEAHGKLSSTKGERQKTSLRKQKPAEERIQSCHERHQGEEKCLSGCTGTGKGRKPDQETGYPGKNEVPDRIAGRYQQDIRRI